VLEVLVLVLVLVQLLLQERVQAQLLLVRELERVRELEQP
jgi:hypothetical protein